MPCQNVKNIFYFYYNISFIIVKLYQSYNTFFLVSVTLVKLLQLVLQLQICQKIIDTFVALNETFKDCCAL